MGSLTTLLSLYCDQGKWPQVTSLYRQIRKLGIQPNSFTFTALLNFSSASQPLPFHQAQSIHADATKRGFLQSDTYVINALITMYARHSSLIDARKVFNEIPLPTTVNWNTMISTFFHAGDCNGAREHFDRMQQIQSPNDITWSAMIAGYTQNGRAEDALHVFKQMRGESDEMRAYSPPNSHTIASVLTACGQLRDLCFGEQVHGYTTKISTYIEMDVFVGSTLIDLYGRCCQLERAKLVFDSMIEKCVVAWSILIATYVRNECPSRAIEAFRKMVYEGAEPNYVTLSTLITACANIPNLILGMELHGFIVRRSEMKPDVFVSTSLIDMYGKCHYMIYAYRIFERVKNVIGCNATAMYNATISGFVDNNCLDDALQVFRSMNQHGGFMLNSVTMAIVLPLCTRSSSLLYGKEIHCYAIKKGLDDEILVGNSLLDMYSKCGKLHLADNQFKMMIRKNRISWTSMINGYGIHGDGEGAIRVFQRMVRESDVMPDHVTFVALISACSHSGLVEEGLRYFELMNKEYGIIPVEENYGSLVDLLARSGRLDEAKNLIATMPMKPGVSVWGALLGACRIHGDVKEAENAAENLRKLEPEEGGFRKLLSSIYSEVGRLDSVAEVRRAMREMDVRKRQGFSWLETNKRIYGFVVGDTTHERSWNSKTLDLIS